MLRYLFILFVCIQAAHAESELTLRMGTSSSHPIISNASPGDSKYGITAGLGLSLEFSPQTYLETGVAIRTHTYSETSTTEISYQDVLIPIMARYRFKRWLDLGIGFYYVQNPDSFKRKTANNTQTVRFDVQGLEGAEWGLRLNPRIYYGKKKNWFLDLVYEHGLKDLDQGGGAVWKNRVYGVSIGYAISLGGGFDQNEERMGTAPQSKRLDVSPKTQKLEPSSRDSSFEEDPPL